MFTDESLGFGATMITPDPTFSEPASPEPSSSPPPLLAAAAAASAADSDNNSDDDNENISDDAIMSNDSLKSKQAAIPSPRSPPPAHLVLARSLSKSSSSNGNILVVSRVVNTDLQSLVSQKERRGWRVVSGSDLNFFLALQLS